MLTDTPNKLSKNLVRRAYDATLERTARLLSFASALQLDIDGDVASRQTSLAIDDLTVFALNARRLIAETKSKRLSIATEIPTIHVRGTPNNYSFAKSGESVPVSRLLNALIHHVWIEVYRDNYDLRHILDRRRLTLDDEIAALLEVRQSFFPPKLAVQSDHPKGDPPIYFVELQEFLVIFITRVLNPIVELCTEHGLYLEEDYRN